MTSRSRAGLPPLGWFLAGLAGSALVAGLVGIPPGDTGTLLAVITLAALVVVAAGLGLQSRMRRRRARVARQGALTAAVTAAVALAGLWLHADHTDVSVAAKPAQQLLVAATISWELTVAEQPSLGIQHGSVMGTTMGLDPADDNPGVVGHAEVAFPLDDSGRTGTHRPGGRTHQ